jgi:predicted amidohydrolase
VSFRSGWDRIADPSHGSAITGLRSPDPAERIRRGARAFRRSKVTTLKIATCQFPVGADIARNTRHVLRQIRESARQGADVAHFCEGALSGYAGVDFTSFADFDWTTLESATRTILQATREAGIWVLLGSSHRISPDLNPHNSVYVIDDSGSVVDRYDKRFCSGDPEGESGDLSHYSPGDYACVFEIRGVRCGVLICYDYRFPELYRVYKRAGVDVLFHSFHAGNATPDRLAEMQAQIGEENFALNRGTTYPEITMPATMQAAAASNHLWISCSNTSARESCWPAFFVRADGVVIGRLRRNVSGVLITEVDPALPLYDSTRDWRDRAMEGVLHSGRTVDHPRTRDRTTI